ncbi:unnamed protein product [Pieris brassicae]|uniref:Uncharacterized protein n=1 Tax=Pieris brassicae TaxID=7116 RepID=A0A9P0XF57_PIEBR|nr:unnamed protein product [Pieris brassicae]
MHENWIEPSWAEESAPVTAPALGTPTVQDDWADQIQEEFGYHHRACGCCTYMYSKKAKPFIHIEFAPAATLFAPEEHCLFVDWFKRSNVLNIVPSENKVSSLVFLTSVE